MSDGGRGWTGFWPGHGLFTRRRAGQDTTRKHRAGSSAPEPKATAATVASSSRPPTRDSEVTTTAGSEVSVVRDSFSTGRTTVYSIRSSMFSAGSRSALGEESGHRRNGSAHDRTIAVDERPATVLEVPQEDRNSNSDDAPPATEGPNEAKSPAESPASQVDKCSMRNSSVKSSKRSEIEDEDSASRCDSDSSSSTATAKDLVACDREAWESSSCSQLGQVQQQALPVAKSAVGAKDAESQLEEPQESYSFDAGGGLEDDSCSGTSVSASFDESFLADGQPKVGWRYAVEGQAGLPSGALLSKGSANHALGTCIPCRYIHAKSGCMNGTDCEFCHCHDAKDAKRVLRSRPMCKAPRLSAAKASCCVPTSSSASKMSL